MRAICVISKLRVAIFFKGGRGNFNNVFYLTHYIQNITILTCNQYFKTLGMGLPGGSVVKNPPANAGDAVLSLVWEDPTCRGATKSVCHNY